MYHFAAITSYGEQTPEDQWFLPAFDAHRHVILEPGEALLADCVARGLELHRGEDLRSEWVYLGVNDTCYVRVGKAPVHVILTSNRVIVVCEKFEKGGGWIGSPGLMLTANAVSKAGAFLRRHGKVLTGQMRVQWISRIGYHEKHNRKSVNALRLMTIDKDGAQVLVDVTLGDETSPRPLIKHTFAAVLAERQNSPDRMTAEEHDRLSRRVFPLYEPGTGKLAFRDIPGALAPSEK